MTKSKASGDLMPVWSPPFGKPPFPMLKAELLMVEFETDQEEINRITPAPLQPAGHNRLTAFVGDCSQLSHSLGYHEVAIIQPVEHDGKQAVTVPYIWTSTDTALLAGRELYGMPKLLCDHDTLRKASNEVTGYLHRNGTEMMSLSMVIDGEGDPATLPFGANFTFVRHIPSPDPARPDRKQLVWIELEDCNVVELWQGRGHAEFHHPLSSGLDRIKPAQVTHAWYGTFTWTLPWAKVLDEWEA